MMMPQENTKIIYEEFLKLRENSSEKIEFINDIVYMSPAPVPKHQKICFKLARKFDDYLKDSKCEMLQGINLRLYDEGKKINDVIPDISVFCDYKNLDSTFIEDVPLIIVEIVSPSSVYLDNIIKTDSYKRAGVSEYWIVNLKNRTVTVWNFKDNEQYIYTVGEMRSEVFKELCIPLKEIFD